MIRVELCGPLAEFGAVFDMKTQTPREALQLLLSQIKGLRKAISKLDLRFFLDGQDIAEQELALVLGFEEARTLRLDPVISGAGIGDLFRVVAGIALIGAAIALGPVSVLGLGGAGVIGGTAALATGVIGASLLFGGVANMLSQTPGSGEEDNPSNDPRSYLYNGPATTVGEGIAMPMAYGTIMVGGHVVNQRVANADYRISAPGTGVLGWGGIFAGAQGG